MEAITPHVLFDRLRGGESEAIQVLIAQHLPPLRSFIAAYAPTKGLAGHVLQRAWLRFAAALDATALAHPSSRLHTLAKEELLACLDEQLRRCMQGQDALGYGVVSRAADRLKSHDRGADDPVPGVSERLAQLDDTQRELLGRRYRDRLGLEALARIAATSDQAVATALFRVRATLADLGEQAAALTAHDRLFATLVEDHLEGALSADARGVLARTIASNLDHLGLFEVQVRMDLVLDAALGSDGTLVAMLTDAVRTALTAARGARAGEVRRPGERRAPSDRQLAARGGGWVREDTTRTVPVARSGANWTLIGVAFIAFAALLAAGTLLAGPAKPGRTRPFPVTAAADPPLAGPLVQPPASAHPDARTPASANPQPASPRTPTPHGAPPPSPALRTGSVADPATIAASGGVRREFWTGIADLQGFRIEALLGDPRFPDRPTGVAFENALAGPRGAEDHYGQRLTAWLTPPVSGAYRFVVTSDNASEVWLSADERPVDKRRIAQVARWTRIDERNQSPEQTSPPIALEAGRRYFIEVLHLEGDDHDFVQVGWLRPDGGEDLPIPGRHLAAPQQPVAWTRGDPRLPPPAATAPSAAVAPAADAPAAAAPTAGTPATVAADAGRPAPPDAGPGVRQLTSTRTDQPAVAAPSAPPAAHQPGLHRERWNGIPGESLDALLRHPRFGQTPDEVAHEPTARSVSAGRQFGERLSGWLVPRISGDYQFDIECDDEGQVWLGRDPQAGSRQLVVGTRCGRAASLMAYRLEAGQRYHFEILHKEHEGPTFCVVGWTLPTGERQAPIPGAVLIARDPRDASALAPPSGGPAPTVAAPPPRPAGSTAPGRALARVQRLAPSERVDLSAEGWVDWAHWGLHEKPLQATRKISGLGAIQLEAVGDGVQPRRHGDFPAPFLWNDGDRGTGQDGTRAAIATDGVGTGFLLTVPADRHLRELRLHVGSWNAACRLDIGMEGEPPQPPDLLPAENGRRACLYVIRYAAGVDGRRLRLRWIATSPGHAWLAAAALSPPSR